MAANFTPEQLANIAYQEAHPDDDRRYMIIASCVVCLFASYVAVGVRLWARRLAQAGYGLDDYTIVAALFFFTLMSITACLTTTYGMGKHLIYIVNAEGLGVTSIIAEGLYNFVVSGTKISVLCFYGRIFPQRWFRNLRFAVGGIIVAFCISQLFTDIFQCTPVSKFWNPAAPGFCIDFWAGALTGTVFNVIADFVTLTMPVPLVWKLKVNKKRRLQLIFAFTIGGVACIASVVRGFYTPVLRAFDITWEFVGIVVSTEVELMMFFISACIPTYATLFNRYRGGQQSQSQTSPINKPSTFATKRSQPTFAPSESTTLKDTKWSTLDSKHSQEEINEKEITITTAISTSSESPKEEKFLFANAV